MALLDAWARLNGTTRAGVIHSWLRRIKPPEGLSDAEAQVRRAHAAVMGERQDGVGAVPAAT